MPSRIEDYALIGDCQTAALISRDGSVDWLCFPRFDSSACFAALLGDSEHGRWLLTPAAPVRSIKRRYRDDTLVLETDYETDAGAVTVIDCMPQRSRDLDMVRIVVGRRGTVPMKMELIVRCDYGSTVPWVTRIPGGMRAIAGPDMLLLYTDVDLRGQGQTTVAEFTVSEGQRLPFVLVWQASHHTPHPPPDAEQTVKETEAWWRDWSGRCTYQGPYRDAVVRSLITLKALTYAPTGGITAAPTTSLPEQLGGVRNWDYRFCWLRDATLTLFAMMQGGYVDEAKAWRAWLLRAVAGNPGQMNIMYGLAGERRLTELVLSWLPGYEGAAPVRIGNAAHEQFQLDVFGEVLGALHLARMHGLGHDDDSWRLQCALVDYLETAWQKPDEGIWEVRGPRRHFTHSKIMAWVAVSSMIKSAEHFGDDAPLDHWRALRDAIHDDVCQNGFDPKLNSFVQYYGAKEVDASLLMMALVGFLPANDPRVVGTVAAVERLLMTDGFVARYVPHPEVDGLPPGEGTFLPCTFWLADNYVLMGRYDEAKKVFERLVGLANDVGLLSEEYDPHARRLVGNFPQAFTHVALVNSAHWLARGAAPAPA